MKRKLSLLMVLMMVLTLIPAMPSFAATKAEIPNPATIEYGGTTNQPILVLEAVTDVATGSSFTVTLTNGEFTGTSAGAFVNSQTIPVANRIVATVPTLNAGQKIQLPLNVKSTNNADITADVWGDGAISNANGLVVAKVAEGNVSVGFRSVTNIRRGDNTTQLADLEIRELNNNAFKNNSSVEIRLDNRGYEFIGPYSDLGVGANVITNMTTGVSVALKVGDPRTLVVTTTAPTTGNDYIVIKPKINVTRDARLGEDVFVRAYGVNTTITPADRILAAKYTDFGVNFKVEKVLDVKAGRHIPGEYVAVITMEEAVAGSLSNGRVVEIKLPGASLQDGETVYVKQIAGNGSIDLMQQKWFEQGPKGSRTTTVVGAGSANQSAKVDAKFADAEYKVVAEYIELQTKTMSTGNIPGKWEIRLPFVVNTSMTGDLNAEITVAREKMDPIKVATVQAPVTIEVKKGENGKLADLIIGKQHQSAPEILIKENYAGALLERDAVDSIIYSIEEAQGYKIVWNGFDYEVVEGDLEIYGRLTKVNDDDKGINIAIDRRSSKPSTIKISNIDITLDRTVPYGEHPVEFFMGNVADAHRIGNFLTDAPFFNVVTPYPEDKQLKTVFTIGEAEYVQAVDGRDVKTPMDVAPQIVNNRTVLPIRYVADALGAKVNYDPATRTAIFSKDAMVVSMTLDTNVMYVNGSPVVMDVTPMVQNDRALVPVVYVAQAFGLTSVAAPAVGDIVWDAAAKTVTLFPNAQ